jgi:hypothetical protein
VAVGGKITPSCGLDRGERHDRQAAADLVQVEMEKDHL